MYYKEDPRIVLESDTRIPEHDIKEVHSVEFNRTTPIETEKRPKVWWVTGFTFLGNFLHYRPDLS